MQVVDASVFANLSRSLCPIKREMLGLDCHGESKTIPHPKSHKAVYLEISYVLLHLFLWHASASEPQELSESLPDDEEEGFNVL